MDECAAKEFLDKKFNIGRTIMVEHRYKSNDLPGHFGGFEWSGDVTDILHVPGWFSDYVQSIALADSNAKSGNYLQNLYFLTNDDNILKFFVKELI